MQVTKAGLDEIGVEGSSDSPLFRLNSIRLQLRDALHRGASAPTPALVDTITGLAGELDNLFAQHVDTLLCALLVDDKAPYAEIHPLMVAITCAVVARSRALEPATTTAITCAALSCNLGMIALHEAAAVQSIPLNSVQQSLVHQHPIRSAALLHEAGVADPIWLDIVSHHHEKVDGSGYPHGLRGNAISVPTRLVALADIYAAMVLPRQYRDGIHAQHALREIFLLRGTQIDAALAADFIHLLGVYPPGIFVRLKNDELGVVVKRGQARGRGPVVSCFRAPHGGAYPQPLWRNIDERSPYAIEDVLPRQFLPCSIATLCGVT